MRTYLEIYQYSFLYQYLIPYVVITGMFYFLFYLLLKGKYKRRKIQSPEPKGKDIRRDLWYSLLSMGVFPVFAGIIFTTGLKEYSKLYMDVKEYSGVYFVFSIIACLVVQDTWYYWMHRAIHHESIFRYVHLEHHRSTNPTPFTSYSFHPLEAIAESFIFYIIIFLFPVHHLTIFIAVNISLLINVYGHLGYEVLSVRVRKSLIFRIINTSVHHNMHHQRCRGNYGLYFRFWDRLMKTEFKDYEKKFNDVVSQ